MRDKYIFSIFGFLFILVLVQGCALTKNEKKGPITGKVYNCWDEGENFEYEMECKKDTRNKCMAKLSGISESDKKLMDEGRIAIGMKKELVYCSYGKPDEVNKSHTPGGNFEQWVYRPAEMKFIYLYFKNGVLIASHENG